MTHTFTFDAPGKLLSLNDSDHWRTHARRVKAWRTAAAFTVPRYLRGAHLGYSQVEVTLPVLDNRRRDPSNLTATVKAIVDGLVDDGVWEDDSSEHLTTLEPRVVAGQSASNGGPVTITITLIDRAPAL